MALTQPLHRNPKPKTSIFFLAITISASLVILSAIIYCCYYLWFSLVHKSRTSPFDAGSPLNKLQKFSYKELKSATNNFSASNYIGKGGSGTVFRGILSDGKLVAVKLLDSDLLQSEQEFQNELVILGGMRSCALIVSLTGFCVEKGNRLLVFEYMPNRSLQESLFFDDSNNSSVNNVGCDNVNLSLNWGIRFNIILDVAKALAFLHLDCEPAVVHGDVKPSNVLLDSDFKAKLSDFGLSRLKLEHEIGVDLFSQELSGNLTDVGGGADENENQTPPIIGCTPLESQQNDEVDFALALQASNSSKTSCSKIHHDAIGSPGLNVNIKSEGGNSNLKGKELLSTNENGGEVWNKFVPYDDELSSIDHSTELNLNVRMANDDISSRNSDWWWKQDENGELCSKDYVTEWIGSQICSSSDITDWDIEKGATQEKITSNNTARLEKHEEVKETSKRESGFECLDNGVETEDSKRWSKRKSRSKNHRKMHEWWKDEKLDEISKKGRAAKRAGGRLNAPHFGLGKCFEFRKIGRDRGRESENDYDQNPEFSFRLGSKKKRKSSRSMASDMFSGDLFSRELSSTTSMRGTLCYVAPEYTGYGYLMEKGDIYSLGVLILVVISGRRPLHVLASPMKLEKANLISWARSLAYSGSVLELVDGRLRDEYNKEQASLCISLALACLQKMPELRPDIGDIVKILKGEMEIPQLPFEYSPSPPSRVFSRSRRKPSSGLD